MSLEYRIGDVFDRLAEIPDGTIDLIVTSPPFLALRSYLPADHPDKGKEIGSEATPAAFIDTLLELTAELGRVLAPHGSLCVELGDTYSGSGGAGGDYNPDGLRDGQAKFDGSASRHKANTTRYTYGEKDGSRIDAGPSSSQIRNGGGSGWPLAKSLTGIPTLYPWSLAYGRNLLRRPLLTQHQAMTYAGVMGETVGWRRARNFINTFAPDRHDFPPWRIRNIIVWARPNPPVGALGDKFRPATSYITVACKGPRRFFDLDAVRTDNPRVNEDPGGYRMVSGEPTHNAGPRSQNPAGAPPLDWHTDLEDGDWLWKLPTQPYKGSHYATFPLELPTRLITAMCPLKVCTVCGKPSERITDAEYHSQRNGGMKDGEIIPPGGWRSGRGGTDSGLSTGKLMATKAIKTLGWSDCGHNSWRTGVVLDPFAGSGTTLQAAQNVGRHAIGIDLDPRNADLARDRVGMFLEVNP